MKVEANDCCCQQYLIYAHRKDAQWHDAAYACIAELAERLAPWVIPWPCIHEFLAIVTHPRIYAPPTPLKRAIEQINAWMESPSLTMVAETDDYWTQLQSILHTGRVSGPQVHDARIVALCLQHGASELWTADRDFSRFPGLNVRNPLVKPPT